MTDGLKGHDLGPNGDCICPRCETRIPHRRGIRCREERCPKCGAGMFRVGSEHYRNWLENRDRAKRAKADAGIDTERDARKGITEDLP
jgi:hypothetical protein